jgi:hypothetical protein
MPSTRDARLITAMNHKKKGRQAKSLGLQSNLRRPFTRQERVASIHPAAESLE